jgi:hypothetical protein
MVRKINVKEVLKLDDREWLGAWPTDKDFDEIIDEDCDVYGPDGELLIAFRKKYLKYCANVTNEQHEYWKWAARLVPTNSRGMASGREITEKASPRLTNGQVEVLRGMLKGKYSTVDEVLEEANKDWSKSVYGPIEKQIIEAELVDVGRLQELKSYIRKRNSLKLTQKQVEDAQDELFLVRAAWFENWVRKHWDKAEDRIAETRRAKKKFVSSQTRGNQDYSAIVGAFDRTPRIPYGRLTKATTERYEDFLAQKDFYTEMEAALATLHPPGYEHLVNKFSAISDPRFSLFGHCFTTITVNYNYQVAYHRDGNNCPNAVACLTTLDKGTYDGYEFVLPEIRLGFRLRHGDVFIGDNQGFIHGMMPMENGSPDAESVWFVFYSREKILTLESFEVECCRKDFVDFAKNNLRDSVGKDKPKDWTGVYDKMWSSPEWEEYKSKHCPKATNTNSSGT